MTSLSLFYKNIYVSSLILEEVLQVQSMGQCGQRVTWIVSQCGIHVTRLLQNKITTTKTSQHNNFPFILSGWVGVPHLNSQEITEVSQGLMTNNSHMLQCV